MADYTLIVTEKPSVARDIGRVLGVTGRGSGYLHKGDRRITWCVGHLLQLAEPTAYNKEWRRWDLANLPMVPDRFELQPRSSARDQWAVVAKQLREASQVINACDAGREGELIFAWAYEAAKCTAPVRRLWISSMTDGAIRDGFSKLKPGKELAPLESAARCRAEADWLVGLNATRAMTARFATGGERVLLSVGRVQTPTLALLCKRETEIEAFVPEAFWQVKARLKAEKGEWDAVWSRPGVDKQIDAERVKDKAEAEAIVARLQDAKGTVTRVNRKKSTERPPQLYDLTTLQKEANKRFKFSAKRTLEIAQALYETHKVLTYPRTDSRHLGEDQVAELPPKVSGIAFGPYAETCRGILDRWPVKLSKRFVDNAEVSDHHAIIPTGVDPSKASLNADEKRVFDLVARRTLAMMLPDAVFAVARMDTTFGGGPKDVLTARGRTCLEAGWRTIDPPQSKKKEVLLPPIDKGDAAEVSHCKLHEGTTKPPRRFTEGTLLAAMEGAGDGLENAEMKRAMKRNGLGTAATRAAIIETLLARNYAARDDSSIVASPHGRRLLTVLPAEGLTSPQLTGAWEARLVSMAEGGEDRATFMADVVEYAREVVDAIRSVTDDAVTDANFRAPPPTGEVLGACPRCSEEVREARYGWRCVSCAVHVPNQIAQRAISPTMARSLLKDGETKTVKGFRSRAGKEFAAGLQFDADYKVKFAFSDPDAIGDCPACGKPVRPRGKVFTCDTGRECSFVVFEEMAGHKVMAEEVSALLAHGQTELIRGLQGRDGPAFDGVLKWLNGRVRAVSVDPREAVKSPGNCRSCQAEIRFVGGSWRCSKCDFSLPGAFMQRPLYPEEVAALLRDGHTWRLNGLRKRSEQKPFKAALRLGDDGRIEVDFSPAIGGRPLPAKGVPPAFGERVDCPKCVDAGAHRPGYVIAGKSAWGCSTWRSGCKLRVPFVIEGVQLTPVQARRLFGKDRATLYETAFAASGTARIALRTDSARNWALEIRRAKA